jgi:hypothetical protein
MLNIIEVKGQTTVAADYNSKQGTVAKIESGTAANSANFRRRRIGNRLRSQNQATGGWRVTLGFRF